MCSSGLREGDAVLVYMFRPAGDGVFQFGYILWSEDRDEYRSEFTLRVREGDIEMVDADPLEKTTIVSEHAIEGAIETGVQRFRFSGQIANVHLIDWNGVAAPESPGTPDVHINYGVPGRKNSS